MQGLEIKNFDPRHVSIDPLVVAFYDALDKKDMKNFLENKAGIWWYPILEAPTWLDMFRNASHRNARENAEQFLAWENEYKPCKTYSGWGYSKT
jgi:hypothetical protein